MPAQPDPPNPDHAATRDLLLRLSVTHDTLVGKQRELELTQHHRLRHSL